MRFEYIKVACIVIFFCPVVKKQKKSYWPRPETDFISFKSKKARWTWFGERRNAWIQVENYWKIDWPSHTPTLNCFQSDWRQRLLLPRYILIDYSWKNNWAVVLLFNGVSGSESLELIVIHQQHPIRVKWTRQMVASFCWFNDDHQLVE